MTGHRSRRARVLGGLIGIAWVAVSEAAAPPKRIVSLIPSVTEMIFAMGAADRLVGVSSYDRFPPEVSRIPKVGGLLDPNVESILALRPDLVILYGTQVDLQRRLERANLAYYPYEHRTLADITVTVRAVAKRIGVPNQGERLAADMEQSIDEVRRKVATLPRPRTLLVFGREPGSLRNVQVSGGYGFLHDILEAAGGVDAFGDLKQQMVQASTEMILARKPDVIVELRADAQSADAVRELESWNALPGVPAVKNHRIYFLVGDRFVVPGPRVVDAIRELSDVLHRR